MAAIIPRMPDYRIGREGTLMEWREDYEEVYPEHRHVSHMIGLYPGRELSERPDFWEACKRTLEKRTPEGPSWCKVWKCCLWARMKEGEKAYAQLRTVLEPMNSTEIVYTKSGCQCNLLCTPPFQIDGNLGAPAAIMEMLVQDKEGELELLPAIPKEWSAGSIEGMKIIGGHELSFAWENRKVKEVTIKGGCTENILLKINNITKNISLEKCRITNIMME